MRRTLAALSVLATLASVAPGMAQTPYSYPASLVVVPTGQMSRIGFTTNLDVDCHFRTYVPIDVVNPPANGQVFLKRRPDYPSYPATSNHAACNRVKRPGVEILYKSRPGFAGTDAFVIRMLDENHVPLLKRYTAQVQ